MTQNEYIEDIGIALDVEDYEEANTLINAALKDKDIPSDRYTSITKFAKNRGFSFGEHFNLIGE